MRTLVGAITLLAAFAALSTGQTISGDLTGVIYDPSGAVVATAAVSAKNQATGVETNTTSTSAGQYRLSNLPPGSYSVTVTATGFQPVQKKDVQVSLAQSATVNFTLTVAATSATVEVTEAAAAVDTTSAQVSNTFSSAPSEDLPIASIGTGALNLSLLNAGVTTAGAVGAGTGPSVGGQRPRNNNYTIEGIDNNLGSVTGPVVTLPNDGIAEFSVLQNQFSAEFGHSSGGQFNQVVKSGTNTLHGELYEYFENRNLNAADNLSVIQGTPLHPRFDDNRFGFAVGGPLVKNKVFYYALYEYNPVGNSASAGLVYSPTAQGYSMLSSIPNINQTNLGILKQYLPPASSALPPSAVGGAYPLVGPGNESLNAQLPGALSIPIGQLSISAPSYENAENAIASIDDTISEKDSVRFRFILNRTGQIDTAASLPVFFQTLPVNGYEATLSEFHTFSPVTTNEFRLGFNRFSQTFPVGNQVFPNLDSFPNLTLYELGGVNIGPDPNAPQFTYQNTYQLTDNVTWLKGSHTFKFGFDGIDNISPQSFTQRSRGDYEWSYLSDYLFDYNPDYLAQRSLGNVVYYGNRFLLSTFAADTWKIRSNLSINLGVRYEFETVPLSENLQELNSVSNTPGVINFRSPSPQTHDFAPRLGVAYSPGKSGNTSIRAGFGMNYDVLYDNQGILSLPPELTTTVDVTGLNQGGFLAGGGIAPNATGVPLTNAQLRAGTGGYIPNQVRPQTVQWNFGIQHVFRQNYILESRYLGTHGYHLPVQIQLNRQPVVTASNALPLYLTAPSQATLNSLTNTLGALTTVYNNSGNILPGYLAGGFTGIITAYEPWGNSIYHGWANQITRRFTNDLQFIGAYTWSHAIDDSTADVFSTYVTPRRPENAQDLALDRSGSALDHRNRITAEVVYNFRPFKNSNWFMKNIAGNWQIAPIYAYQTGTLATVQSGQDSNLNGDTAGDRTFVNASGQANVGSGATPLTNSSGAIVGYVATNPNARYIVAPKGVLPNGGRNTAMLRPIDDIDISFAKMFNVGERFKIQISGRFVNIMNHPQYTGGFLNDVAPAGSTVNGLASTSVTSGNVHNFLIPSTSYFLDPTQVFSSNPRAGQLSLKVTF